LFYLVLRLVGLMLSSAFGLEGLVKGGGHPWRMSASHEKDDIF